jgi:hypothetical protein
MATNARQVETPVRRAHARLATSLVAVLVLVAGAAGAQKTSRGGAVLPGDATALEGLPTVLVETTSEGVTRRRLDSGEAAANGLRIRIEDGAFYWTSRDNRRLAATDSRGFTYLSSADPGQYVRISRLNDRLSYIEHVDTSSGSVTYWGELRIVTGK